MLTFDPTAKVVTLPDGWYALKGPIAEAVIVPQYQVVILPAGYTSSGGITSFDLTTIITLIETYGPQVMTAIQAFIKASQSK